MRCSSSGLAGGVLEKTWQGLGLGCVKCVLSCDGLKEYMAVSAGSLLCTGVPY